jgi:hypothetical protein
MKAWGGRVVSRPIDFIINNEIDVFLFSKVHFDFIINNEMDVFFSHSLFLFHDH